MDFLSALIILAANYGISEQEVRTIHSNYCQNLYWQPNSREKMERYACDITAVSEEIQRVQRGEY